MTSEGIFAGRDFAGYKIVVVADPHPGFWTRPRPMPSKRSGRKGTRRAWKQRNGPRFVWPAVTLERGQIIRHENTLYMRHADLSELRRRLAEGRP